MTDRRRPVLLGVCAALAAACASPPQNLAPVVRIETPTQTVTTAPGVPVRITGTVHDPDGDAVRTSWDLGNGTTVPDATVVDATYPQPGTFRVALTAVDERGAAATPAEVVVQVGRPPAGGAFALAFGGTGRDDVDRVKIAVDDPSGVRSHGADVGATDMTIELMLRAEPGANQAASAACGEPDAWIYGNVVLDRDRYNQDRKFGLSLAGGVAVFGVAGDGSSISLCGTTRLDDGRWHHVAVTRSVTTGEVRLFVDGRPEASVPDGPTGDVSYPDGAVPGSHCGADGDEPCTRSDPYLVIGAEKHDAGEQFPSFRGQVDELRLSTVVRYTDAFDPPRQPFTPDPQTASLHHFDEGGGVVARDSVTIAPGPSDGILQPGAAGPTWVPSDAFAP